MSAETSEATVLHAYGLVRADAALPHLPEGIGGAAVHTVRVGPLCALVSELDEAAFGPRQWQAHGEDPVWLAQVAAEHNRVLQELVEDVDLLPLRLPGLHADRRALEESLTHEVDRLTAALERVGGHVEWAVKVFLTEDQAEEEEESERPRSGRDYLMRKAGEAQRREGARQRRTALVLDAHTVLADAATHAVVNSPQDSSLSGRPEPMLLNAAYLVARGRSDDFLQVAQGQGDLLQTAGMKLEVSGPWPAYNFVDEPDSHAGATT